MLDVKYTPDGTALLHIWRVELFYLSTRFNKVLEDWNNIRFHNLPFPKHPDFTTLDVRKGLPYPDNTFDGIYAFHISEHLDWHENTAFNQELLRILKPGGICRLSTPDLLLKATDYKEKRQLYRNDPSTENRKQFHWATLVLIDQMIRLQGGGELLKALKEKDFVPEHIFQTHGDVFKSYLNENFPNRKKPLYEKNLTYYLYRLWHKVLKSFGRNKPALFIENEVFYFDKISYPRLMQESGFTEIEVPSFEESRIPNWLTYELDKSPFGNYPIEPSVYVEGVKPK